MLDFYGLHVSYVALFSGGVYMEIESLRLDFHLKRKQKKTTRAAPTFSSEKKEKKKKKNPGKKEKKPREEGVRRRKEKKKKKPDARPGFAAQRPGSRVATWSQVAARPQPVSPAWIWRGLGLELISISSSSSSSSSSLSFFFLFLSAFSSAVGLHFGSVMFYFWVRNRVLETRFSCRHHLEKVPRKRQTTHENRALKTRFRSPKSSL